MKIELLIGISLAAGLTACTIQHEDGDATASSESEEIGACGANSDPSTGVICTYSVGWSGSWFDSVTVIEQNTLDYAHCTWMVACRDQATPTSGTSGATCLSVIGTGCSDKNENVPIIYDVLMPPGTPANQAAQVCRDNSPSYNAVYNACRSLGTPVDQGEDLCCLPRTPPPPPSPTPGTGALTPSPG
jgi:hypothetical protein